MIVNRQPEAEVAVGSRPAPSMSEETYRSVSRAAVVTMVLGLFSASALLSAAFLVLPLAGLVSAALAWFAFRRYPEELIGRPLMWVGGALSGILFVAGVGWNAYCYYTEVPEDYERISYRMLKLSAGSLRPFSVDSESLDGKKVFIKGYVRPSERKSNLKDFILVGDFGQCCFGGSPKITDVIAVSLQGDLRVDYSWRLRHIGGTFRLNRNPKRTSEKDVPQVVYSIEADYLK